MIYFRNLTFEDYLKERVEEETTKDGFSKLPFRYIEMSKVLLDVYAFTNNIRPRILSYLTGLQMILRIQTNCDHYSRISGRLDKPSAAQALAKSTIAN
jgi:hypothetical protein